MQRNYFQVIVTVESWSHGRMYPTQSGSAQHRLAPVGPGSPFLTLLIRTGAHFSSLRKLYCFP